ncbi:hypothetical protein E4T56_gene20821, partial [Termitomyces sp. T112]
MRAPLGAQGLFQPGAGGLDHPCACDHVTRAQPVVVETGKQRKEQKPARRRPIEQIRRPAAQCRQHRHHRQEDLDIAQQIARQHHFRRQPRPVARGNAQAQRPFPRRRPARAKLENQEPAIAQQKEQRRPQDEKELRGMAGIPAMGFDVQSGQPALRIGQRQSRGHQDHAHPDQIDQQRPHPRRPPRQREAQDKPLGHKEIDQPEGQHEAPHQQARQRGIDQLPRETFQHPGHQQHQDDAQHHRRGAPARRRRAGHHRQLAGKGDGAADMDAAGPGQQDGEQFGRAMDGDPCGKVEKQTLPVKQPEHRAQHPAVLKQQHHAGQADGKAQREAQDRDLGIMAEQIGGKSGRRVLILSAEQGVAQLFGTGAGMALRVLPGQHRIKLRIMGHH